MEEIKLKVKKSINNIIKNAIFHGQEPIDFYVYKKKGLTSKEITEIIVDFALDNYVSTKAPYFEDIFFSVDHLVELLKYEDTKEKVIKLFQKYHNETYDIHKIIRNMLIVSNFNLYFLIGLEGFYDFTNFPNSKFESALSYADWTDDSIKRFFIYFLNNPGYLAEFLITIIKYFPYMGETLQRFLVFKTDFLSEISTNAILTFLDNENISNLVKEKMLTNTAIFDEDISDIVKFYFSVQDQYKKYIFSTEEKFFMWLGKQNKEEVTEILDRDISKSNVEKFFLYNPNWVEGIENEEQKVKLKFEITGVPDEVKDQIILSTVGEVTFDGEDVERMFADYRDSPSVWVRYYVDEELWDHTMNWDYNPDESTIKQYYWDDLTPENLNKIKEILKENNPDLDLNDEDAVQEAAFEDDEIISALYGAAAEGERSGDETKLVDDIKKGIDELFGKGNWRHSEPGVIKAMVDISKFDENLLSYAYNDCGEWDIRCIFFVIHKDHMSDRDKPSLPEYRYGIQGDFDKSQFNDYIEGNL